MAKKPIEFDSEEISQIFKQNEHLYEKLQTESLFSLEEELAKTNIKIHSIPSRIKGLDSFLDKINFYRIKNPFEEINDIVGLRVICLFLTDIEKIGNVIRNSFDVIKEDNKIDNSKFASFGYLSVHFIVKLGKNFKGTRYNNILDMPFEVQVRTIAMDAWANISHYLDYKTDKDIPKELKRDFYALSGMFYVADKHFQMFFETRKDKQENFSENFERGDKEALLNQSINLDTLMAYARSKFPERRHGRSESVSKLVDDLIKAGFKTIGEIDEMVNNGLEAFYKYEAERILSNPQNKGNGFFDTGIIGVIATLSNDTFLKDNLSEVLEEGENLEELFNETKEGDKPFFKLIKNKD